MKLLSNIRADMRNEARKGVRTMLQAGVDLMKLMATGGVYTEGEELGSPQLTVEQMRTEALKKAHALKQLIHRL